MSGHVTVFHIHVPGLDASGNPAVPSDASVAPRGRHKLDLLAVAGFRIERHAGQSDIRSPRYIDCRGGIELVRRLQSVALDES